MPRTVFLHTLGSLELRDHRGRPVDGAVVQPKRIALLVYLAAARPRGFHRRDTLISLLWPELDSRRARAALNKAVHHIRASLGADAIVSRGSEELALNRDRVWCDVVAVEDALDAGRPEDALDLYQGDLLQGFHISGAVDFEHWLDLERERIRWRVREATWGLADAAEAAGNVATAIRWARTAQFVDPEDEGTLRRLIEVLHRTGNDAAAFREFEAFARRLRDLYGIDPSPETCALVESLRARAHGADTAAAPESAPPTLNAHARGVVAGASGDDGGGFAESGQYSDTAVIPIGMQREWTFRSVIEGLADAVTLVDGAGTIHYISAAVERILGLSPAEMIGRPIWDFVHEDDIAYLKSRLASRIRGEGDPKRYTEIRMWHRDGHLRVVQLRGRLYVSRSGTPMVLVAARDITEQRLHGPVRPGADMNPPEVGRVAYQ